MTCLAPSACRTASSSCSSSSRLPATWAAASLADRPAEEQRKSSRWSGGQSQRTCDARAAGWGRGLQGGTLQGGAADLRSVHHSRWSGLAGGSAARTAGNRRSHARQAWLALPAGSHGSTPAAAPPLTLYAPRLQHRGGRQEVEHGAVLVRVRQQAEGEAPPLQRRLKLVAQLQHGAHPQHKLLRRVLGARVAPHRLHAQQLLQHRAQVPAGSGGVGGGWAGEVSGEVDAGAFWQSGETKPALKAQQPPLQRCTWLASWRTSSPGGPRWGQPAQVDTAASPSRQGGGPPAAGEPEGAQLGQQARPPQVQPRQRLRQRLQRGQGQAAGAARRRQERVGRGGQAGAGEQQASKGVASAARLWGGEGGFRGRGASRGGAGRGGGGAPAGLPPRCAPPRCQPRARRWAACAG